jgi:hypothetical protein
MDKLWNVRGVNGETRRRAKVAAAAMGVPLGVWVSRAIELTALGDERARAKEAAKKSRKSGEVGNGEEGPASEGDGDSGGTAGALALRSLRRSPPLRLRPCRRRSLRRARGVRSRRARTGCRRGITAGSAAVWR